MRKAIKAIGVLAIIVLCAAVIGSFREGNIKHVKRTIPQSAAYSQTDIARAMNIVERHFKFYFDGCTLTDLWYDKKRSESESDEWAEQYHADEAMVLLSNFYVGSHGDQCLGQNTSYTYWSWVLVRNTGGPWQLMTWGLP